MTQYEEPQQPGTVELKKTSDSGQRDWTDPMYQTNEFKMFCWKIVPCTIQEEHDHSECPFAHPGENNVRRDPRIYKYRPEACPATQSKNGKCSVGVHCHLAHNVFERWLHPQRFRTQMCRDGADCKRKHTCFFAHADEELRVVPDLGLSTNRGNTSSIPPPPACPSPSAKRTSSLNSGSSSMGAFTLPGSPAALSRSTSSSSSSSRASSTAAMSPLSCVSRQNSFPGAQSPPLFGQQQLNALSGAGYAAQAKYNKQWGLQPGLSGPTPGYQAGLSGPFIGSQAASAGQAQAAALAVQLQQQLELQQRKQQQLEQLQLQMLLQQQQAAILQPDLAALLEQQVAANMQQAAQACAAAKAAEDQLAMLRVALGSSAAAPQLPYAMQHGVPMPNATAPGDVFSFSPSVQPAHMSFGSNHTSSNSFMAGLGINAVSAPLAASPVGATASTLQQDDMLLALMLAQQQQVRAMPQASHVSTFSANSVQYGFQPVSGLENNNHQASQLAAMVAATAATHVPATAIGQLGMQSAASLYA